MTESKSAGPTELRAILQELARPCLVHEMPRRVDLSLRTLESFDRNRNPRIWAGLQISLGNSLAQNPVGSRADNLERALTAYNAALEIIARKEMPEAWAQIQLNLANVLRDRIREDRAENVEHAIAGYGMALEVLTREKTPIEWALAQQNLALAYSCRIREDRAENVERAIAGFEAALEVQTRYVAPLEWSQSQSALALAFLDRVKGDRAENVERAIAALEAALEVQTREAMPFERARNQINLASAYESRIRDNRAANLELAIANYEAAFEVLTQETMPVEWAKGQVNLGVAYRRRIYGEPAENVERAIVCSEAALEILTRDTMPVEWAMAQCNLANAYSDRPGENRENLEHAIACIEAALEVLTSQAMPVEHAKAQLNIGRLLSKVKKWREACSAFRKAMETAELLYQAASTPQARQGAQGEFSSIHPQMVYALAHLGEINDLQEAVTVAERGRARSMSETLALDEASLENVQAEDKRMFEYIRGRIQSLQAEVRLSDGTPGFRDFVSVSSELGQAYAELKNLIGRIRVYAPEFFPETRFEEIRRASSNCPLAYLITTTTGGVGLLVGFSGNVDAIWMPDLAAGKLREKVVQYLEAYSKLRTDPGSWTDRLDSTLRWLWDAGLGNLVSALDGHSEAVLIPGGLLGLLPLHASWKPDANRVTGRRYAFDEVTFRYVPSARGLIAAARSVAQVSPDAVLAVDEPRPTTENALPNSEREVLSVVRHFSRSRVLRHEAATREAVQAELVNYPVLHFSCHGMADFANALEGGMVMANDETLSLRTFLDTRLPKVRLAVLSACETAVPGTELPDEVLSLPSGLMQAGVDGVVGSLWPVLDESTMLLMFRFYDLWCGEGLPPSEALRTAQQWVRDTTNSEKAEYFKDPSLKFEEIRSAEETAGSIYDLFMTREAEEREFSHPLHWAGFCYIGV